MFPVAICVVSIAVYFIYVRWKQEQNKQFLDIRKGIIAEEQDAFYDEFAFYRTLIYSVKLLTVLFVTGFIIEYLEQYHHTTAIIEVYKSRQPPFNCGINSVSLEELSYWKQFKLNLNLEDSDRECRDYLLGLKQSPYPNPMKVLLEMCTKLLITPLRVILNTLALNWIMMKIALILFLVTLCYMYYSGITSLITSLFSNVVYNAYSSYNKKEEGEEETTQPKQLEKVPLVRVAYKKAWENILLPTINEEVVQLDKINHNLTSENQESGVAEEQGSSLLFCFPIIILLFGRQRRRNS